MQQNLFEQNKPIVYVGILEFPFNGMLMSHMASTNINELHKMADTIGVNRKWFQDKPGHPHYDICKSKKRLAIKNGATEINDRELVRICFPELNKKSSH